MCHEVYVCVTNCRHTATPCNTLQHTATHCNALLHDEFILITNTTMMKQFNGVSWLSHVWHDSPASVTWLIQTCHKLHHDQTNQPVFMTHSYETWHICMCDVSTMKSFARVTCDLIILVTNTTMIKTINRTLQLFHMGHDSFARVTCLVCTCDMTHSYLSRTPPWSNNPTSFHDSFIRDMTHLHVWHASYCLSRTSRLWHHFQTHVCVCLPLFLLGQCVPL